jgi:hypothetical protein
MIKKFLQTKSLTALIILNATILLASCTSTVKLNPNEVKSFNASVPLAQAGDAEAQFKVAEGYCNGTGVQRDYAECWKWLRLSADQGFSAASRGIGQLYQKGLGVEPDQDEAFKWYILAAKQGSGLAHIKLGDLYPGDRHRAWIWYSSALTKRGDRLADEIWSTVQPFQREFYFRASKNFWARCDLNDYKTCK